MHVLMYLYNWFICLSVTVSWNINYFIGFFEHISTQKGSDIITALNSYDTIETRINSSFFVGVYGPIDSHTFHPNSNKFRNHDLSKKYGMAISIPKTNTMIFSREDQLQVNIKLDDISLEQVNQYKYLGVTLTPSNDSSSEIKGRLMLASTALGKL